MRVQKDLIGLIFSRLTVLEYSHAAKRRYYWRCRCQCGNEVTVARDRLVTGNTRSCGCLNHIGQPGLNATHGKTNTPIYRVWVNMLRRCNDPKNPKYKGYGARGITVCEAWHSFEAFYSDMGDPPAGMTLDRIDNNLGYHKENCRWATPRCQSMNRQCTVRFTYGGETQDLYYWSLKTGLPVSSLRYRIRKGWDPDKIIKTPLHTKN